MQLYDWDSAPERITVLSLDEVLGLVPSPGVELLGLPQVDDVRLIKIDVEGMEKEVLAGARRVVQAFKPIVWTENVAYFSSNGASLSKTRKTIPDCSCLRGGLQAAESRAQVRMCPFCSCSDEWVVWRKFGRRPPPLSFGSRSSARYSMPHSNTCAV